MSAEIDLRLLQRVAGLLLPAAGGLVDGGSVAFGPALAADPSVRELAVAGLEAIAATGVDLDAALARLAVADPPAHEALLLVVVAAYYANPTVRAATGYPGPAAIALPPLPDARDAELAPLLERVQSAGRGGYRAMPSS